jgi:outer membrane protein OmpA-like peptidoglycan-associated protein
MSYCANCGTQISDDQNFCPACGKNVRGSTGTAADPEPESVTPPANTPAADFPVAAPHAPGYAAQAERDASLQKLAALNAQASPPAASNSGKKILIAIVAIIFVGGMAIVGGGIYLGYKVKQKASAALDNLEGKNDNTSAQSAQKTDSGNSDKNNSGGKDDGLGGSDNPLSAVLGKLQGGSGDQTTPAGNMATNILEDLGVKNPGMPPDLVRNIPYSAVKSPLPCPVGATLDAAKLANGLIHIKPGTVLTTSWSLPKGDAEADHAIQSVSPGSLNFQFSGIASAYIDMSQPKHPVFDNTVCGKDLVAGEAFATGWQFTAKDDVAPGLYPGLSRILLPEGKFATLKSTGSMPLVFAFYSYMDTLTEWEILAWKGTLTRVEPDDVQFPLIIDDDRVTVPAIHVRGQMKVLENAGSFGPHDQPADAYILDDPNTPVVLSWLFGKDLKQDDAFQVQYVRVRYGDKPTIEQQLEKNRKAITWGINFDYNSDVIKPVSEPVLKEIAQAMANKPDWKLTVTGHTDNIGGDKYNLALSQRRSAAVKAALVNRYYVNPSRLSTGGDGDSDPVDTNDTLEGRARNRRVELTLD